MHLAQLNVARPLAPLDSPELADFVARLAEVNARADAAPGFVWRLQDDDGDGATGQRLLGDDSLLVNLSVWESFEALQEFVFGDTGHRDALRRRRDWFRAAELPMTVCWWIEPGTLPTLADAEFRLTYLREHGPSAKAFPFTKNVDPSWLSATG